jgi:mannose-1-phosphate guanylyltransferase/phosphomannomutase
MAGGEGTRLRPLTYNWPKPMLPIANKPMMEHVIALLKRHGFEDLVVTVAFMANAVRTYFGDGSEFGVRIVYATEQVPLGTAGSVLNAAEELGERFLVISGDVLCDVDLSALVQFHEQRGAVATIGLYRVPNPLEFGIVITDQDGRIERFLEKPSWGEVFSDTVNTGIYVLEPEVLSYIPAGEPVDFSQDVFPKLLADNKELYGHVLDGYWEDVGTLEAYLRAHADVLAGKVNLTKEGFELRPGVFVGEGSQIHPSATIHGRAMIGPHCRIGPHARVGPDAVLGPNVRLGEGAIVENSVIHDNTFIGAHATLRSTIVARKCDIRENAYLDEGSVVGESCFVGAGAIIEHGVKVYPNKTVEAGAVVNTSIVFESRAARSLFGQTGVVGLANVDITPELATRLAMAWASSLPIGTTVTASRDSSRAARMLKRALMVGVNAAGVSVEDLEVTTLPVTRFAVRAGQRQGGVSVRLAPNNPEMVLVRFMGPDGIDVDSSIQRKIERLYQREEFRRVPAGEIGDIDFPGRTAESYTAELVKHLNLARIREARFKLVLDYSYGTASFVMANVLSKLGAEVLGVNPYGSTREAISADPAAQARNVSELVKAAGASLGAVIDKDGEELTLIDERGHVISADSALLVFSLLVAQAVKGAAIGAPVSASHALERCVGRYGATVTRAKVSFSELMRLALSGEVDFVGSTWNAFIFPRFLPAFDAVASLAFLLDLLALTSMPLSAVHESIPPVVVAHREVALPWEAKGALMRSLVEDPLYPGEPDLVDGIKYHLPQGWVLLLPDPERAVVHVFAEHDVAERSEGLASEAERKLASRLAALGALR